MKILHVFDHSIPLHSGYTFRSRAIVNTQRELGWETAHVTSAKHAVGAVPGAAAKGDPAKGDAVVANAGSAAPLQESVDGLVFHRTHPGALANVPVLNQWDVVRTLAPRIAQVARAERPDILHAHSPCLNGLAALKAGRALGIPVVYEVRAFWEDAAVDHGTATENGLRYKLTRALETHVLKRADQVTCICEGLRQDIVARGVPADKVTVIPNAVDIAQFPMLGARDAALEETLGLRGKQVLGFIGSFYAYEGLDLLLAALPAILEVRPDTRLLLVGGGPQEQALKAQAASLGIEDKIVFTGRVPHAQVPAYSSLVDAFVFPRKSMRLTELVTPLKPLEAMAQGRVVLASDVGGHKELIEHGRTGYLFRHDDVTDLARCASQALADPAALAQVIANGRAFVENERNWRASVRRYEKVYAQALAARGPGPAPAERPLA
jgi:PEP-CTERM/exosortase A-associated glycosyltransferase